MWFFVFGGLLALTGTPVRSSCPIEISPKTAVAVKYLDPLLVNCTSLSNEAESMGWESSQGGVGPTDGISFLQLNISSVNTWDLKLKCYIGFKNDSQCGTRLPVVVYKLPDRVTLSQEGETSPWVEGESYQLQCDLLNVAPARYVSVSWYKGDKIMHSDTLTKDGKRPVNVTTVFNVTASRDDNEAQIWCEAKLNLQEMGVNLPPVKSEPRNVTVHYPPTFINPENETLVFKTGETILDCTAAGNPEPQYQWQLPHSTELTDNNVKIDKSILTLSAQLLGTYTCTASNPRGTSIKYFTVEAEKSYLLLIIGIVAAIVFVALFLFIFYCIHYKKTRIGRYIFKHASQSVSNGRVAHDREDVL